MFAKAQANDAPPRITIQGPAKMGKTFVDTPTVRSYPRTMQEAFGGKDAEYACAIQRTDTRYESGVAILVVVALFIGFAAILVQWM